MIIPIESLSGDILSAIIKEFVLREGTDYGGMECNMEEKTQQVYQQLKSGTAVLVYSELHETVNILPADQVTSEMSFDQP